MNRHAYCIIAHADPAALQALVDCIDDERNDIFILVDAKSHCDGIRRVQARISRLVYLSEAEIFWGDVSQVRAEMALFSAAHKAGDYAYYHLLSGQDMPLKDQDAIHAFCDNDHPNQNFIGMEVGASDRAYGRIAYYYLFTKYNNNSGSRFCGLMRRVKDGLVALQQKLGFSRIGTLPVAMGSNWASLSKPFVEYLVAREKLIFKRYSMTSCPDEIYKQTELLNSPFRDSVYDGVAPEKANLRAIDWTRGNPYVWQFEDWPALKQSGNLFARKVTSANPRLLETIVQAVKKQK